MSKFNKQKIKQAKKQSEINIQKSLQVISALALKISEQLRTADTDDSWINSTAKALSATEGANING